MELCICNVSQRRLNSIQLIKKFELSKVDRLEKQLIDYKISLLEKENSNSLTYSLIFSKNISFKDLKPTSNEI